MSVNPLKRSAEDWRKVKDEKRARRADLLAAAGLELCPDGRLKPVGTEDGTSPAAVLAALSPDMLNQLRLFRPAEHNANSAEDGDDKDVQLGEGGGDGAAVEIPADAGLEAVTPLFRMPYSRQLQRKRNDVVKVLRKAQRETRFLYNRQVRQ